MEWNGVNSLQSNGPFSSLGLPNGDSYHVGDDCLKNLEDILNKLCSEDRTLRTFRRALGFFQVIKKELLPLLIFVKNDHTVTSATIRVLVNLTVPVECLLPIEVMSRTEVGLQTISELNNILQGAKEAFLDPRSTKAVVEYVKQVLEKDVNSLSVDECESVNNCLLLIRNILHTPEPHTCNMNSPHNSNMQNQLIWNLFSQGVDKVLINLMTCSQKSYWGVTMVQLIALMYKDQHVSTMQKLLNFWFEASLSESSEDNESNTSPPDQNSGGSSPMLTSDPTSDSSDTGSSSKDNRMLALGVSMMGIDNSTSKQHIQRHHSHTETNKTGAKSTCEPHRKSSMGGGSSRRGSLSKSCSSKSDVDSGISSQKSGLDTKPSSSSSYGRHPDQRGSSSQNKTEGKGPLRGGEKRGYPSSSEASDCGYGTQHENPQQSASTSSNEDDRPQTNRNMKPVHQKPPTIQKTRYAAKPNLMLQDQKEWRKKKLSKRTRTTNFSVNIKALMHYTPSDEDISNLLKEFTVEFLLKGYGALVQELHGQLLNSDHRAQIDTSHFFWLVTYFLKFAAQLELELDIIKPVLSFDILSYLTYEGVNLFEQLSIASCQGKVGLTPFLRRIHLVVTAIREILQAIETYKKITHLSCEDRKYLLNLQLQIGSTDDLRCLFVLLLQHYNPSCQSKQYLQDLIVTNHMFLLCLDNIHKLPEFNGNSNLVEHIRQFATVEVMSQYGLLLEDFRENGEFINNCIFTMMHHISGDLEEPAVLFQPCILKSFSEIWERDFEICDDWSDLIEYVMHKFINILKPSPLLPQVVASVEALEPPPPSPPLGNPLIQDTCFPEKSSGNVHWYNEQSAKTEDHVGVIRQLYQDNGVTDISRMQIKEQLLTQDIIDEAQYDQLLRLEGPKTLDQTKLSLLSGEETTQLLMDELVLRSPAAGNRERQAELGVASSPVAVRVECGADTVAALRDHLVRENKNPMLRWLQTVLLETCFVKLSLGMGTTPKQDTITMEPIPLHYTMMKQSIPIVPWNSEQKAIFSYQPFVALLHKLGFHLPADSGKVFARIPHFWTADVLLAVAEKLGPISSSWVKFDVRSLGCKRDETKDPSLMDTTTSVGEYLVHRSNQSLPIIRYDPLPNSAPTWLQFAIDTETPPSPPDEMPLVPTVRVTINDVDEDFTSCRGGEEMPQPIAGRSVDRLEVCNVCETGNESVASDLTHMCISDEELGLHSGEFQAVNQVNLSDVSVR